MQRRTDSPPDPGADKPAGDQQPNSKPRGGEIEQAIGHRLKAMFDHVVSEPVPDRFVELLARLELQKGKPEGDES